MKLRDLFCKKKTATPEQEAARDLYDELSKPEYNDRSAGFYTDDLHDDMSLVHESIFGWWKPRFLMDHRTKEAYELMDSNEQFVQFTADDVDWDSLKDLEERYQDRAKVGDAHFPTHVGWFENGVAQVWWQINPDGRYYMDEDGYGMTDDEEIQLVGAIDRTGKVVEKYRYQQDY